MRLKTTIALLLTGLALVFAAAACGGNDNESSSGGQTTTEESTTTTESTTTGGGGNASMELQGETGPGFTIEVMQNGADADEVKAGTYTLKVEDKSEMHNFHLIGPGVDEEVTDVPFVGEKEVTVTLQPGMYTYQCDPHAASGMKGTFEVT
jgi:plastocyanin